MQLKEYLQELYEYNYWANKRYLAVAETLTEEQLFRKQGQSWDSVHAVLVHMMSSERMWPQRWRGEQGIFLEPGDFPTIAAVRQYWVEVESNMRAFIAEQTEEAVQRAVTYTNPRGETFTPRPKVPRPVELYCLGGVRKEGYADHGPGRGQRHTREAQTEAAGQGCRVEASGDREEGIERGGIEWKMQ